MTITHISYPRFISRYALTMMQQIGRNGTNGHMKPRTNKEAIWDCTELHWISHSNFTKFAELLMSMSPSLYLQFVPKSSYLVQCTKAQWKNSTVAARLWCMQSFAHNYGKQNRIRWCCFFNCPKNSNSDDDDDDAILVVLFGPRNSIQLLCLHIIEPDIWNGAHWDTGGGDLSLTMAKRREKPQKWRWWPQGISILCFSWLSVALLCWLSHWQQVLFEPIPDKERKKVRKQIISVVMNVKLGMWYLK